MANRVADTARDEANNPVSGATASLRLIGGGEIDSTTTDAGGFYAFTETEVGYPGPIFVRVTDTNGVSRERTSNSTGKTGTIFMSDLARAFLMMTDGVFSGVGDELAVSADGVTMNLVIDDGMAFLYGHPYYQPGNKTVTVAANGTANPRIDLVVIRLKPPGVSGEGEIVPAIVQGTPAASPVAPGSTQDPATVWEYPLAQILVDPGVSSIAVGKVTDVRIYTSGPLTDSSVTTAKLANLAVIGAKIANETIAAGKLTTGAVFSTTEIAQILTAPNSGGPSGTQPSYIPLTLGRLSDVAATAPTAGQVLIWDSGTSLWKPGSAASGDASTNTATSVDGEIVLFSGTTGKILKRATTTGLLKATAGVLSAATPGTDYGDASSNTATSVDSEIALFSSTTGKVLKRATTTGMLKATAGVIAAATAGTDYSTPSSTESLTNKTFNANGTGNSITNLEVADLASGVLDTDLSSVAATDTTLPSAKATKTALDLKSNLTHVHVANPVLADYAIRDYYSPINITSAGQDVASVSLTLLSGVTYICVCDVDMQGSAPPSTGTYIQAFALIATGSSDAGTKAAVPVGERPISARQVKTVVGTGAAVTFKARANTDGGTGVVNGAIVRATAYPQNIPAS